MIVKEATVCWKVLVGQGWDCMKTDKEKDKEKAIDNGRSKKEPSCVADVVAEDCVSPLPKGARFRKKPCRELPSRC